MGDDGVRIERRRRILKMLLSAVNSPIRRFIFFESPKRFNKYVGSGQTVLDLGCGGGYFIPSLAKKVGLNGKVIAIDIEEFCIDIVKKKIVHCDNRNIEVYAASAENLEMIEDDSVDFLLANGLLCMMPLKGQGNAIREMKRVIKPGGKIFVFAAVEDSQDDGETVIGKLTEGIFSQEFTGRSTVNKARWEEILREFGDDENFDLKRRRWYQAFVIKRTDRMKGFRDSIIIKARPEDVWTHLASLRIVEWMPYMAKKEVECITTYNEFEDLFRVGTITAFDKTCKHEIVESRKHSRLKYKISEKSLWAEFEGYIIFRLVKVRRGTLFIYGVAFHKPDLSDPVMKMVMNPLTNRWLRKRMAEELCLLKNLVEQQQ